MQRVHGLAKSQTGLSDSASIDNGSRQLFPQQSLWESFLDPWSPPEGGNGQLLLSEAGNSALCQGQSHFLASLLGPWAWNQIPLHCAFKRRVPTRP